MKESTDSSKDYLKKGASMHLWEFADKIRQLRIQTAEFPQVAGFAKHGDIWVKSLETEVRYNNNGIIFHSCKSELYYADVDPNSRSVEAQLIRSGIWNQSECGWLMAKIKDIVLTLAKVTPSEKVDLDSGIITNSGILVLWRNQ